MLVAAGGMVGTGARYQVSAALPSSSGWPTATLVENLVGSFLLGLLLEGLLRRGTEGHRGRLARLGLGTGALGGFTTFSSLAIELERLLADGAVVVAASYAMASVLGGLVACFLGIVLAGRHPGRQEAVGPVGPRSVAADHLRGDQVVEQGEAGR